MSNNRSEISRKLIDLQHEYDSFDRYFYTNFKICTELFHTYLRAPSYACTEFSRRMDEIKNHISDLWKLCNNHTGGWFDNDDKRQLDKLNRSKLYEIEQNVNRIISIFMSYDKR